jgi:hypothetical protein
MCFECIAKNVSVDVAASTPNIPRCLEWGGGSLYLFANEESVLWLLLLGMLNLHGSVNVVGEGCLSLRRSRYSRIKTHKVSFYS